MKSLINKISLFLIAILLVGCQDETGLTQSGNYGFAQFKLLKESSLASRDIATDDELERMFDAKKIQITMSIDGKAITQSLELNAFDEETAEFGLRSEKVELLAGEYSVSSFRLFDANDLLIYTSSVSGDDSEFLVKPLILNEKTLPVIAKERGHIKFLFTKETEELSRAADLEENIDFIKVSYAAVELENPKNFTEKIVLDSVALKAEMVYDEVDNLRYRLTSTNTHLIPAGEWKVNTVTFKDRYGKNVASPYKPATEIYEIEDNQTQELHVKVGVNMEAAYIKDYQALKAIWDALDGKNWSYAGQIYPRGANWDFNREIDLWGSQPGVKLHPNGRVASLNISEFGFRGDMPEELGNLTELLELYLGTHNDINGYAFNPDPALVRIEGSAINGNWEQQRQLVTKYDVEKHLKTLTAQSISPYMRAAYWHAGREIPGGLIHNEKDFEALLKSGNDIYKGYASDAPQVKRNQTRADVSNGTICNGLTSLPASIGNLKSLQLLYIANGLLETLPQELANCEELVDLEIYNCTRMLTVPRVITELPNLVSLNLSENKQIPSADMVAFYRELGLAEKARIDAAVANGLTEEQGARIQLLYNVNNSMEELPVEIGYMYKIGLMMFSNNKISKIYSMPNIAPVQLILDGNQITEVPDNFVDTRDMESIIFNNNQITKLPNLFSKDHIAPISSVSFAYNKIDGLSVSDEEFGGVYTKVLDLSNNKLTTFPSALYKSGSLIETLNLAVNGLTEIPEGALSYPTASHTVSIDLHTNRLSKLPRDFNAENFPFLFGVDLSFNSFSEVPVGPLNCASLTIYVMRSQRDEDGNRCLKTWLNNIKTHKGLRGYFIGSNDIRLVKDELSYLIYNFDISDNPNIQIDLSDVCPYIQAGMYNLYYDRTQDIRNCPILGIEN